MTSSDTSLAQLDFVQFVETLKSFNNIAITAPAGADGDSVGTQCAMKEALEQLLPTKKIRILNEEPCPIRYRFLKFAADFEVASTVLSGSQTNWPDCLICVDGGFSRIGDKMTELWTFAKARGQIDHHIIGGKNDYSFRLYDPKAASTTEIVFKFVRALSVNLTQTLAQAIYVGLIFDTGLFKHSNATPDTLRIAAELMTTGFNHTETVEKAMLIKSDGAFAILKHLLASARFELNGSYVWSVLDHKTFLAAGGDPDDREGLIDQIFLTRQCRVAAFYFERFPGEWKISFRSRGPNVAALAQFLNANGGGHVLAAGCSLNGNSSEVLERCHQAVRQLLSV
jgi:phosphoesterase RecJ-like protein